MASQPHLASYDLYFSLEADRLLWFSFIQRLVLVETVPRGNLPLSLTPPGAFFLPEDPQHLDSFIPLPRFEEVSSPFHLALLWRKLRLCCIHLPAEVYQESNSVPVENTSNSNCVPTMKNETNEMKSLNCIDSSLNSIEFSSNSIHSSLESLDSSSNSIHSSLNSIEFSSNSIHSSLESLDSSSNSIHSSLESLDSLSNSTISPSNSFSNSHCFEAQRIEAQRQKRELAEVIAACSAGL